MKNSEYIKTISINDPRHPGEKIVLAIHQLDGGYIGVDTNYIDEVANYLINPFEECEFVKLTDPMGNDDEIDPPLNEDIIFCFLNMLVAFDDATQHDSASKEQLLQRVSAFTQLNSDQVSYLLGIAREFLGAAKKSAIINKDVTN